MVDKKKARLRRARRARARIQALGRHRLCVHRTPRHIYAQVLAPDSALVVASASTLDADVKAAIEGYSGNCAAAVVVGRMIAEKARAAGLEQVAFDRSGYRYHGRVKALADAAREHGLQF